MAGINQKNIAFRLRPREYAEMEALVGRNRSLAVRGWIEDYLKDPIPFPDHDDNLKQVNLAVEPRTHEAIVNLCEARRVPIMTLVRQIVEQKVRGSSA